MSEPYFTIGQLAQLFDVEVPTLRYYDEIGLLKPAHVDAKTHYRYYATAQFERLSTIKYFRALGLSIAAIQDFFAARELPKLTKMLQEQQTEVRQQIATLQAIEQRLDNRLTQVAQAQSASLGVCEVVTLPQRSMVYLQQPYTAKDDIELVIAKLRAQYGLTQSVFLGKISFSLPIAALTAGAYTQYDGILLVFEPGDQLPAQQQVLVGGAYLQVVFQGTHAQAGPYYQQLLATCREKGYQLRGPALETALIDYGITDHVDQSVTRIQIPINA